MIEEVGQHVKYGGLGLDELVQTLLADVAAIRADRGEEDRLHLRTNVISPLRFKAKNGHFQTNQQATGKKTSIFSSIIQFRKHFSSGPVSNRSSFQVEKNE